MATTRVQPSRRIYRQYAVAATRTAEADMSIPSAQDHAGHVERIMKASNGRGFWALKL
jgi:hypothetical protein